MPLITTQNFPGLVPDLGKLGTGFAQGQQIAATRQNMGAQQQQIGIQANEARLNQAIQTAAQISATDSIQGKIDFLKRNPSEDNNELLEWYSTGNEAKANEAVDAMTRVGEEMGVLKRPAAGPAPSIKEGLGPQGQPGFFAVTPQGATQIPGITPAPKGEGIGGVSQVQSSVQLPGGAVQLVRKDGTVELVQPKDAEKALIMEAEQRGAELQGLRAGERKAAENAQAQAIDAFKRLTPVRQNIANLNEGIRLLDEGASTGVVESKLPSVKRASIELDNLQARLGLDVIGNTTFGALSESELAFALSAALPKKLDGPDLKRWMTEKRDAQTKLANYLNDAAIFLGTPGNTITDFLQRKRSEGGQQATQQPAAQPAQQSMAQPTQQPMTQQPQATGGQQFQEGATATNPSTGQKVIYTNGQWQPAS